MYHARMLANASLVFVALLVLCAVPHPASATNAASVAYLQQKRGEPGVISMPSGTLRAEFLQLLAPVAIRNDVVMTIQLARMQVCAPMTVA